MATCPNCQVSIPWDASDCSSCRAIFDDATWRPVTTSGAEQELALQARRVREDAARPMFLQTGEMRIWSGKRSVKIRARGLESLIWWTSAAYVATACLLFWVATRLPGFELVLFVGVAMIVLLAMLAYIVGLVAPATIFPSGRVVRRIGFFRRQIELGLPLRIEIECAPSGPYDSKDATYCWNVLVVGPRGKECVAMGDEFAAETWRREISRLLAIAN